MNTQLDRMWIATLSECNEVQRRRLAGIKALEIGRGGTTRVCALTGMSHHTVLKGVREVQDKKRKATTRLRKEGGGRKKITEKHPDIITKIERILDETTAGDPMSLLKWTSKSTYTIANTFKEEKISPDTIARIIKREGYTLQANRKAREGKQHPDRNAQFEFINTIAKNSSNKEIQSSASIQRRKNSLETSRTRDKHGIKRKRDHRASARFQNSRTWKSKSLWDL